MLLKPTNPGAKGRSREQLKSARNLFDPHRRASGILKTAKLAEQRFESDRFEEFCAKHLAHLDEIAWNFFGSDLAKNAVARKVQALFPAHEHDSFTDLFWTRIQEWRRRDAESRA